MKLFVKLPRWFKIDTPIGDYNPDWAFVTEREEKLYFVRETKARSTARSGARRRTRRSTAGGRHFDVLGTDFDVVTSLAEVKF